MITVPDQFELSTTVAFSGSYVDDVVFGDYFAEGFEIGGNERRRITSKIDRSPSEYINQSYVPFYIVEGFASGSFMGRPQKSQRAFSDGEFFFDSIVPNPLDIHLRSNATDFILWVDALGITGSERWGIYPVNAASTPGEGGICHLWAATPNAIGIGTIATNFYDLEWVIRYPFESKYKGVERLINFDGRLPRDYDIALDINTAAVVSPVTTSNVVACAGHFLAGGFTLQVGYMHGGGAAFPPPTFFQTGGSISPRDYFNLFFGTGDGNPAFLTNQGPTISGVPFAFVLYGTRIDIRGYKYGLYASQKTRTSNVYRYNRFGQFRDMLEQRPVTKFFDQDRNTTVQSPVIVRFLSGTQTFARSIDYVTATNPDYNQDDSGIYDFEYKAGKPFSDNR